MTTPNQQPEVSAEARRKQIMEWIERHNLPAGNFTDMQCAFEDAETINLQRAIDRANEKLNAQVVQKQILITHFEQEQTELKTERDQLRTELATAEKERDERTDENEAMIKQVAKLRAEKEQLIDGQIECGLEVGKLRAELSEWKQAAEIEAKCHDETLAKGNQLRAENEALRKDREKTP